MTAPRVEATKFDQMFDYLSAPEGEASGDGAFVFGRKDVLVARSMANLVVTRAVEYAVISGGIGKDSGDLALPNVMIPEAHYLAILAEQMGLPLDKLLIDIKAKNGGDNARNGIDLIVANEKPHDSLVVVAHATSLRRLTEQLRFEAGKKDFIAGRISALPTAYMFDAFSLVDQREAVGEMKRLLEWPQKDWLGEQPDLPMELAEYAVAIEPVLKGE